jgi:hypothetical protein
VGSAAITCYESMKHLKLSPPVEIANPKTHLISVVSEEYRMRGKLAAYTDPSGVTFHLDSWMELVPAINRCMKTCMKGKMPRTFYRDDTRRPAPLPYGMHLFAVPHEITESLIRDALRDASNLYLNPRHRDNKRIHMQKRSPPPACNLMFHPEAGGKNPKLSETFKILFAEAPALARYALMYTSMIRDILRLDSDEMEATYMSLNHYDPMGAVNPHVDTVYIFNGTLGPIFTVAMGPSEKMLDLLPVLPPNTCHPVRLFSKPNEIMLMDGEARTLWAHSKPWNYPFEQFSLVFKFPEMRTKTHATTFEYEGSTLSIPHHYVTVYSEASNH